VNAIHFVTVIQEELVSTTARRPGSASASATVTATEIVMPGLIEPGGLQTRTRPLGRPAPGQALVAVEATGVSFAEQAMRRGRYPGAPKFPFVPGYDLVGTVTEVGPGVDPALAGQRVAALTKSGGWASHVLLTAADLVPVPGGVDPAAAETVVVNGLTAWQLLHRTAAVRPGQVILVHGANGGVGTTLIQLARQHGVRVIGVASPRHHDALRALGAEPVDYASLDRLAARVRELAPGGVDAVFDNIGGDTLRRSWDLLAPGGALVSYAISGEASGSLPLAFVRVLARLTAWNLLPNGRSASFYNVWAGHRLRPAAFRARLRADLTTVLRLLADGVLTAQIAARLPLTSAPEAMMLAESRAVPGKVILLP
jgi:NADPH:quinone reductase-like Zn-dependent oxidoreductase